MHMSLSFLEWNDMRNDKTWVSSFLIGICRRAPQILIFFLGQNLHARSKKIISLGDESRNLLGFDAIYKYVKGLYPHPVLEKSSWNQHWFW